MNKDNQILFIAIIAWCFMSIVWFGWIGDQSDIAYKDAEREIQTYNFLQRWFHDTDPNSARTKWRFLGFIGFVALAFLSIFFGTVFYEWMQAGIDALNKKVIEKEVRLIDNKIQLEAITHSKHQLITSLGIIDQYLRVLDSETDLSRRTIALQSIQSEITAISKKLVTGEMCQGAITDPNVLAHVSEIRRDLTRLGLTDDRISRDIVRIFSITSKPA